MRAKFLGWAGLGFLVGGGGVCFGFGVFCLFLFCFNVNSFKWHSDVNRN